MSVATIDATVYMPGWPSHRVIYDRDGLTFATDGLTIIAIVADATPPRLLGLVAAQLGLEDCRVAAGIWPEESVVWVFDTP